MSKIIKCKYTCAEVAINEEYPSIKINEEIIVDKYQNYEFFLDESCFENGQMPNEEIKWSVVYQPAFVHATSTNSEIDSHLWGLNEGTKPIHYLGMNNHYKTETYLTINNVGKSQMYYEGHFQQVMVFTDNPENAFIFYILPVSDSWIMYAYFTDSEKKWNYGDLIELEIATHNLHSTKENKLFLKYFIIENTAKNQRFGKDGNLEDIDIDEIQESSVWSSEIYTCPSLEDYYGKGANQYYSNQILIDYENWREGEVKEKEFSVIVLAYHEVSNYMLFTKEKVIYFKNFLLNPTNDLFLYDNDLVGIKDLDAKEGSISSRIRVNAEFMSEILERIEIDRKNQIAQIGDVPYSIKEYDPCGYSTIKISDKELEKTIFDENEKQVIDNTDQFFDIIAGETPKSITITVENLTTDGECKGIMLEDNQTHKEVENVFIMDEIFSSLPNPLDPKNFKQDKVTNAQDNTHFEIPGLEENNTNEKNQRGKDNNYEGTGHVYEIDKNHKEETGLANHDYDPIKQYKIKGAKTLGWIKDKDYKLKKEGNKGVMTVDSIIYRYNKSYNDAISHYLFEEQDYLKSGILSKNFKNLWVIRYLIAWLRNEKLEQTYFVPVSTCRYPNQLAKIRVFPDMKWVIDFNYNIATPLFYKANSAMIEYYSGYNTGRDITSSNNNKRKEILNKTLSNGLQPYVGRKTSFGLSVKCEINNQSTVFELGEEFGEKYRKMLSPFMSFINKLDGDLGVTEALNEKVNLEISPNTKPGLLARLKKMPMEFELLAPSFGCGLGIGYTTSSSGNLTYELDGRIKADTILGAHIKLDILALGSKFKPWGAIIDALDIASWLINAFSNGRVEFDYKVEVRFSSVIRLVGKMINDEVLDEKGIVISPAKYESEAKITYNLQDKTFDFEGDVQGEIIGEIEISTSIKIKGKVKEAKSGPIEQKKKDIAEISIGGKAKSTIKVTTPFTITENKKLDLNLEFSGIKLEIWFTASLNPDEEDSEDSSKIIPLIPRFELKKEIQF